MRAMNLIGLSALLASAIAPAPLAAAAQPPAAAPPASLAASPQCAGLRAEHRAVKRTIADLALGRGQRRRPRVKGRHVGRAAAGVASALLLPFGVGLAVGAGAAAADAATKKKRKPRPAPAPPDVPALIERQAELEALIAAPAPAGCG